MLSRASISSIPPMRNTLPFFKSIVLLAALVLALAISSCGGDDDSTEVGDLGPDPATFAPADAPFYAEAVIRPDGEMAENLESALAKFGVEDPGGMIRDALDQELADSPDSGGITFSDDVEPWLGARAGGFLSDFDPDSEMGEGAVAIATTDPDAAKAFIDKAVEADGDPSELSDETYEGVDYTFDSGDGSAVGVDGDFLVVGTEDGFKQAVDAGAGDSLAENGDATDALDDAPDDSIFSGYVDTPAVIDLIESSGALEGPSLEQFRDQIAGYSDAPVDFWATVEDDAVKFAGTGPAPEDGSEPSDLVSTFPAEAWLAFSGGDFSGQLQTSLDQFKQGLQQSAPSGLDIDPLAEFKKATGLDLETDFNWLGSVGGFVEGTSIFGLGGGVVIESTDDDAASATIDKLETALQKQPSLQITSTDTGFAIQVAGAPIGAEVALQDGRFVLAAGGATVDDVLSPSETLGDSDRFGEAGDDLGDDVTPSFFLDFRPILSLAESTGQASQDPDYLAAKPYLDALDYFIAGSAVDGDSSTGSIVLGLREPEGETTSAVITP